MIAEMLIQAGANVDAADDQNVTPLDAAGFGRSKFSFCSS